MSASHGRKDRPPRGGRSCVDERDWLPPSGPQYADVKRRLPRMTWPVPPPWKQRSKLASRPPEGASRPNRRERLAVSRHRGISRLRPCGNIHRSGFLARRYIGHTDEYHLNKSAIATTVGILGSPHFQPHTQRRST